MNDYYEEDIGSLNKSKAFASSTTSMKSGNKIYFIYNLNKNNIFVNFIKFMIFYFKLMIKIFKGA